MSSILNNDIVQRCRDCEYCIFQEYYGILWCTLKGEKTTANEICSKYDKDITECYEGLGYA